LQGDGCVAVGTQALSGGAGVFAVGIGFGSSSGGAGESSTAVGHGARCTASSSVALGKDAQCHGIDSISIGPESQTSNFVNAVAIGAGATATQNNTATIGNAGMLSINPQVGSNCSLGQLTPFKDIYFTPVSGATQVAAGAVAGQVWRTAAHATLPDGVLLIGI
jgi:hypothetical protein